MSKTKPIELYSLKALAAAEGISYSHMRKLMMKIVQQDPVEWKGWHFQGFGNEAKKVWFAYRGKPQDVIVHNDPKPE